jgi:hypothetical protein
MAFLNNSGLDIFLEIPVEPASKLFRPLTKEPVQIWGHGFPTPEVAVVLPNGQSTLLRLRDYHFERCVAVDKRGTGCICCNTTDPAWNVLGPKEQTNKKGHRVDFPKRPVYLLPVWSYADNAIKVLRGGNQVYENMDKWDTEGRDIRDCDWKVWKTGTRMTTKYHTSRQDSSTFTATQEESAIKAALADALREYEPTPPDALMKKQSIMTVQEATQRYMESQNQAPMAGAPALPPGGFANQAALPPAVPAAVPQDMAALQQQLAALQAQLNAAKQPTPASTTPAPAQGGQEGPFDQKAVAQSATAADPKAIVLESGKYVGKTVGEVAASDPEYLKFYKGYVKDPATQAGIDIVLSQKPAMPTAAQAAPTLPSTPPPTSAAGIAATDAGPDRQALIKEVRAMIDTFPDFKGRGLGDTLIPFLKSIIGSYDYTEASVSDLVRLQDALAKRKTQAAA